MVCEQQTAPGRFRLTVRAVFSCEGPTANDTDYTAECDLTLPTPTPDTALVSPCMHTLPPAPLPLWSVPACTRRSLNYVPDGFIATFGDHVLNERNKEKKEVNCHRR